MICYCGIVLEVLKKNYFRLRNKARLSFDKQKNSLFQGLILHIFCVRISSQLREISDKEKQPFWPDSVPLS